MYLNNNYMTGAVLKDMPNNSGNFTDGAASEQHQLAGTRSTVTVSKDGSLCYPDAQNNPQPIGITIGVFQFNNPNGLERLADSLYQQTAASGQAINEATNNNVERSSIIQGYLESSNVQVVDEMVNMIVAQRAYELNSKAITASDEMLQQANNLRR